MNSVKKLLPSVFSWIIFLVPTTNLHAEPLKVGAIVPLSGEPAIVGENCRKGVELAQREQKKAGLSISVFFEDTPGALAKNTLSAFNKLRSAEKVENFLGFLWAEELGAVGPIADKENLALIGFSLPSAYRPKNAILIWPGEKREAEFLAKEVIKNYSKVSLLSEADTWSVNFSQAFIGEFKKLGGVVNELIELTPDTKDVASSIVKIKKHDNQALIVPPLILFSEYAKALHKLGVKLPLYSAELDQSAIDRAQGTAEGVVVVGPADPSETFLNNFRQEFNGANADIPAANCYDALMIYAQAYRETKSGRGSDIVAYLKQMKSYHGALGTYRFENGETIISLGLKTVQDGKLITLSK